MPPTVAGRGRFGPREGLRQALPVGGDACNGYSTGTGSKAGTSTSTGNHAGDQTSPSSADVVNGIGAGRFRIHQKMTTAKKTTTARKTGGAKPPAERAVLAINQPTAQELEGHLREVIDLIEKAEAMAPAGIVTQTMQRAKVRAVLALETFVPCVP